MLRLSYSSCLFVYDYLLIMYRWPVCLCDISAIYVAACPPFTYMHRLLHMASVLVWCAVAQPTRGCWFGNHHYEQQSSSPHRNLWIYIIFIWLSIGIWKWSFRTQYHHTHKGHMVWKTIEETNVLSMNLLSALRVRVYAFWAKSMSDFGWTNANWHSQGLCVFGDTQATLIGESPLHIMPYYGILLMTIMNQAEDVSSHIVLYCSL